MPEGDPRSKSGCVPSPTLHQPPSTPAPLTLAPAQRWLCVSIAVPHDTVDAVANFLVELGSSGIVEGEYPPDAPLPPTTTVQGFFPEHQDPALLRERLSQYLQSLAALHPSHPLRPSHLGIGRSRPQCEIISSDAWQEQWKGHFPPLCVGQRLLILPPWEPQPDQPDRHCIVINPSMAFGTGHHATTQTCLEALESLCIQGGPPERVLDLGTGSGILAIALAKLGSGAIWATDIDPDALAEARRNATVNQVADALHISATALDDLPRPFPLVIANLFASTLIELSLPLSSAVASSGHAILSGIQTDQEEVVRHAFCSPAWTLATRLPKEEWVTLVLRRN